MLIWTLTAPDYNDKDVTVIEWNERKEKEEPSEGKFRNFSVNIEN